jgi:hypothetical protein
MRLDLRQEGAQGALALTGLPDLDARERAAAIATWRGRMVNETVSSRVFAGLLPQLLRAGLPARRLQACATMIGDELRHGRMCAAVVHALGGEALADLPELPDVPDHADAGPLEAVLRNVLSICCLSETVAVALLSAERLELEPPALRQTLEAILADEVQHARFGWTLMAEALPDVTVEVRERLSRYLVTALRHLEAFELAHLPASPGVSDRAASVGVCSGLEARGLLYDTIEQVIVPQLEGLGLAANVAWARVLDQGRVTLP